MVALVFWWLARVHWVVALTLADDLMLYPTPFRPTITRQMIDVYWPTGGSVLCYHRQRYDCRSKLGPQRAPVDLPENHPKLGAEFLQWLAKWPSLPSQLSAEAA